MKALKALIIWIMLNNGKNAYSLNTERKVNAHETLRRRSSKTFSKHLIYFLFTSCLQGVNLYISFFWVWIFISQPQQNTCLWIALEHKLKIWLANFSLLSMTIPNNLTLLISKVFLCLSIHTRIYMQKSKVEVCIINCHSPALICS